LDILEVVKISGTLIAGLEAKRPLLWQNVLTWAESHPLRYPWRRPADPYHVLIGELLLEKSRSAPVAACERFLHAFPSVADLLAADEDALNRALEVMHLHRLQDAIMKLIKGLALDGKGKLPCDSETLARISGLERHHVRAVFCFGYGMPVAVVDGHVRRMLGRIFANSLPPRAPAGLLETVAESLVSYRDPQTYNGVLLDLAELVCRPEAPSCRSCPVASICDASAGFQAPDRPPLPSSIRSLVKTR
jgi:A/G-specific adenine glycosylase